MHPGCIVSAYRSKHQYLLIELAKEWKKSKRMQNEKNSDNELQNYSEKRKGNERLTERTLPSKWQLHINIPQQTNAEVNAPLHASNMFRSFRVLCVCVFLVVCMPIYVRVYRELFAHKYCSTEGKWDCWCCVNVLKYYITFDVAIVSIFQSVCNVLKYRSHPPHCWIAINNRIFGSDQHYGKTMNKL